MKSNFKVTTPLYDIPIFVFISDDPKETIKELLGIDDTHMDEVLEATVFENPEGELNVVVKKDINIGTLAHESFHCTVAVLRIAGMELNHETEEAFAYLNGWIVEQLHKKLI